MLLTYLNIRVLEVTRLRVTLIGHKNNQTSCESKCALSNSKTVYKAMLERNSNFLDCQKLCAEFLAN